MSEAYLGEIRIFAGDYSPVDWLACNGQMLQITQYQALFALLGTIYGGDGTTTFALPNLQGVLAAGTGQGAGLPNTYALGQKAGTYAVALTATQNPNHTHLILASKNPASTPIPTGEIFGTAPSGFVAYAPGSVAATARRNLDPKMLVGTGANEAHSNMMPSVGLTYIICTAGIFPVSN
jgi:microcystin-dependent protein